MPQRIRDAEGLIRSVPDPGQLVWVSQPSVFVCFKNTFSRLPKDGEQNILITSALPYCNNVPHLGMWRNISRASPWQWCWKAISSEAPSVLMYTAGERYHHDICYCPSLNSSTRYSRKWVPPVLRSSRETLFRYPKPKNAVHMRNRWIWNGHRNSSFEGRYYSEATLRQILQAPSRDLRVVWDWVCTLSLIALSTEVWTVLDLTTSDGHPHLYTQSMLIYADFIYFPDGKIGFAKRYTWISRRTTILCDKKKNRLTAKMIRSK